MRRHERVRAAGDPLLDLLAERHHQNPAEPGHRPFPCAGTHAAPCRDRLGGVRACPDRCPAHPAPPSLAKGPTPTGSRDRTPNALTASGRLTATEPGHGVRTP